MAQFERCTAYSGQDLSFILEATEVERFHKDGTYIKREVVEMRVTGMFCKRCGHTWEELPFKTVHFRPMRPDE